MVCAHLVRSLYIVRGGKERGNYTNCLDRRKKGWKCSFSPAEMFPYLQGNIQGSAWIKQSSGCGWGNPWLCSSILGGIQECENPKVLKWSYWANSSKNPPKNCLYYMLIMHQSKQVFHLLFLAVLRFKQLGLSEWIKPLALSARSGFCTCCKVLSALPHS